MEKHVVHVATNGSRLYPYGRKADTPEMLGQIRMNGRTGAILVLALAALMAGTALSAQSIAQAAVIPQGSPAHTLAVQGWGGGNRNGNGKGNITVANSPSFVDGVQNIVVSANVRSKTQAGFCRTPRGHCKIIQRQ
ncbi:hypothetical protein OG320_11105 [Microbispora sp. NBC_01189]|uniref:hypothetical protein n=1 Tax=Microbispora sp. NBC_01189 TaxID=2903583 RepID=UPI002E110CEA|nr:hypothetical protein OG320_11105 [Microbispora sp. NBC_01189]